MKISQETILKMKEFSRKFGQVAVISLGAVCLFYGVLSILQDANVYLPLNFEFIVLATRIFYVILVILATITILSLACFFVLLFISKQIDKDKLAREQAKSPLKNVTPLQEEQIIDLLQRVAITGDGSNRMNRAEVATFLATLKAMEYLEDAGSYNNLRLWVEQMTGTRDEDKRAFNQQYNRALDKVGKTKYTEKLKKILPNTD